MCLSYCTPDTSPTPVTQDLLRAADSVIAKHVLQVSPLTPTGTRLETRAVGDKLVGTGIAIGRRFGAVKGLTPKGRGRKLAGPDS